MKLPRPDYTAVWASRIRVVLLTAAAVSAAGFAVSLVRPPPWPRHPGLLPAVFLLSTAAATISTLAWQLPAQNVILASAIVAVFGGGLQLVGAWSGVPFGVYTFGPGAGKPLVGALPWTIPFLWLVMLLNSRGVARLALRRRRDSRYYGFWVLALSVLLVLLLELGLEPFATRIEWMWTRQPTKLNLNWYDTPELNFLGWVVGSLLILAFVTPVLIDKKPVRRPPDYGPLLLWEGMLMVVLTGAATRQLWAGVVMLGAAAVIVPAASVWGSLDAEPAPRG